MSATTVEIKLTITELESILKEYILYSNGMDLEKFSMKIEPLNDTSNLTLKFYEKQNCERQVC